MKCMVCERGTASVEVAVMLPLFIVLFAGSMFFHRMGVVKQEALSAARACAFQFAALGCPEDATDLPVCEGLEVGIAAKIDEKNARKDSQAAGSVLDEVGEWWLVGDLVSSLFGTGSRAKASSQLRAFMLDEDIQVSGSLYIVCNTVSQSWGERMNDLMCGVVDKTHAGSSLKWLHLCK